MSPRVPFRRLVADILAAQHRIIDNRSTVWPDDVLDAHPAQCAHLCRLLFVAGQDLQLFPGEKHLFTFARPAFSAPGSRYHHARYLHAEAQGNAADGFTAADPWR